MVDIAWSDVLNSSHKFHGHIDTFFENVVISSGYPYFTWNGDVYKVANGSYEITELKTSDL